MSHADFCVLRASLENDGWELFDEVGSIRIFVNCKGNALTVWLEGETVVLTLPGVHSTPDAPTAFRRRLKC